MSTSEVCRKLFENTSEVLLDLSLTALSVAKEAQPDSTDEDRQAHSIAMADAYRTAAIGAELGSGVRKVSDLSEYDLAVLVRHGVPRSTLVDFNNALDQVCPPPGYGLDPCDLTEAKS